MTLKFSDNEDSGLFCIVSVIDEIDMATAPGLDQKLGETLDDGRVNIILDLSGVRFVDSSGLGVLVNALKVIRASGGDIRLVETYRPVREVLEITGLHQVFAIVGDLDPALIASV